MNKIENWMQWKHEAYINMSFNALIIRFTMVKMITHASELWNKNTVKSKHRIKIICATFKFFPSYFFPLQPSGFLHSIYITNSLFISRICLAFPTFRTTLHNCYWIFFSYFQKYGHRSIPDRHRCPFLCNYILDIESFLMDVAFDFQNHEIPYSVSRWWLKLWSTLILLELLFLTCLFSLKLPDNTCQLINHCIN